ncbi:MAG: FmdB family zinc ribbon protein [Chloroflexota bacterium]
MPRYQYECEACGESFEQRQSFTDDALTDCPLCSAEGSVQRIITQVGVVFKGSGFYINDSKKGGKKEASAETKGKKESDSKEKTDKKESSTESKKESTESKKEKTEKKSTKEKTAS